jgi:hypothetical protein
MTPGVVEILTAKVATGQLGGRTTLLHIPSDRFVVLYEHGQAIWESIEQGTTDIVTLIHDHAQRHGVTDEVAAYEVIVFLDELRSQGFIDYRLPREREVAPLLDAQTSVSDLRSEHLLRLISGKRPFESNPVQLVTELADPDDAMTLAEMQQATPTGPASPAQATTGRRWFVLPDPSARLSLDDIERATVGEGAGISHRRIVHLHGPVPDLTAKELGTIANLGLDQVDVDRRGGVDFLDDVRSDFTVGDVEAIGVTRSRVIVIIVIVAGPIIVIIVIDGGPGPSRGKSRSACKTMCV